MVFLAFVCYVVLFSAMKKHQTMRIEESTLAVLKTQAKKERRNFNNYLENILQDVAESLKPKK